MGARAGAARLPGGAGVCGWGSAPLVNSLALLSLAFSRPRLLCELTTSPEAAMRGDATGKARAAAPACQTQTRAVGCAAGHRQRQQIVLLQIITGVAGRSRGCAAFAGGRSGPPLLDRAPPPRAASAALPRSVKEGGSSSSPTVERARILATRGSPAVPPTGPPACQRSELGLGVGQRAPRPPHDHARRVVTSTHGVAQPLASHLGGMGGGRPRERLQMRRKARLRADCQCADAWQHGRRRGAI